MFLTSPFIDEAFTQVCAVYWPPPAIWQGDFEIAVGIPLCVVPPARTRTGAD